MRKLLVCSGLCSPRSVQIAPGWQDLMCQHRGVQQEGLTPHASKAFGGAQGWELTAKVCSRQRLLQAPTQLFPVFPPHCCLAATGIATKPMEKTPSIRIGKHSGASYSLPCQLQRMGGNSLRASWSGSAGRKEWAIPGTQPPPLCPRHTSAERTSPPGSQDRATL